MEVAGGKMEVKSPLPSQLPFFRKWLECQRLQSRKKQKMEVVEVIPPYSLHV